MRNNLGLSTIVGVILIIAVTVSLVTFATLIVFNVGSETSKPSDVTLNIVKNSETLEVNVLRNNNVENLRVVYPNGSDKTINSSVGSSNLIYSNKSGTYSILAVTDDGSEEVVRKTEITEDSTEKPESGDLLTGTASINPKISGAIVNIYGLQDKLIGSTKTNENGEYEFRLENIDDVKKVILSSNGSMKFNNKKLYASAEITEIDSSTINFNFDENIVKKATVNGKKSIIANTLESKPEPEVIPIANLGQLQAVKSNLTEDYELIQDINASNTRNWNGGGGFNPIGGKNNKFKGVFNGQNHTINNLTINQPNQDYVGLFSYTKNSIIKNTGILNATIKGDNTAGILVGYNKGSINNSYSTGLLDARNDAGGIAGYNDYGSIIRKSYSTADINGYNRVGGLVGNSDSIVSNSYAQGDVSGDDRVGGLVGTIWGSEAIVKFSYATGNVTSNTEFYAGGLVGRSGSEVKYSYWNIETTNQDDAIGDNRYGSTVSVEGLNTTEIQGSSATENMNSLGFNKEWNVEQEEYPELWYQD